jgi:8-oxo-dGTP diphosphatase
VAGEGALTIRIVAAICLEDGRLLTVRKHGTSCFMLPGGKPEVAEAPAETLRREVMEELGAGLAGEATLFGEFRAPAANEAGFEVEALLYRVSLAGPVKPAAEIAEIKWIDPAFPAGADLAPLLTGHVLPRLMAEIGV